MPNAEEVPLDVIHDFINESLKFLHIRSIYRFVGRYAEADKLKKEYEYIGIEFNDISKDTTIINWPYYNIYQLKLVVKNVT